jgi:hypothetical protein
MCCQAEVSASGWSIPVRCRTAPTHSFLPLCRQLIWSYPSISVEVLKVFF